MTWPIKTLDEIFEIARGGSPRPIDQFITDADDGVNWIMIGDASNSSKHIRETKKKIKPSGISRSRLVKPGDFLLTNSMSFGRPYILDTHGCIHDGWLVLSPRRAEVDQDYFYHLLGSPAIFGQFEKLAAGATVKNLNIDLVKSVIVALPPLEEQKRIAGILDQADVLRRKRQRAIDRLNQLGQAIFLEMFSEWDRAATSIKLGDVLEFNNGVNFSSEQKGPQGCLVLDVFNMYTDTIYADTSNLYRVEGVKNISSRYLEAGDIMFVRSSLKEEGVGWPAIFQKQVEPVAFCGFIIRGRPKSDIRRFHPYFLVHFLRLPAVRRRMINSAGKVAITNINQSRLSELEIPEFDYAKQSRFAEIMQEIESVIQFERSALASSALLFASLQDRAFRGEI